MKFIFISDTHSLHDGLTLVAGDVLIHCGDLTNKGSLGYWATIIPDTQHIVVVEWF